MSLKQTLLPLSLFISLNSFACYYDYTDSIEVCTSKGPGHIFGLINCELDGPGSKPYLRRYCTTAEYMSGMLLCGPMSMDFPILELQCPEGPPPPTIVTTKSPDCNKQSTGSIIQVDSQTLTEIVPITGAPFSLVYSSNKVKGRKDWNTIDIPIKALPIN